jgi:hypothetical protein
VRAKLRLQDPRRRVREGENQHSRGVAVEAVNHVHPAVLPRPTLELGGGPGQHRVALALRGGVDEQAGRFVDDKDIGIGVQNRDRRRSARAHPPGEVGVVLDRIVRAHGCAGIRDHHAVDQHVAEQHLALGVRVRGPEQPMDRACQPACRPFHASSVAPAKKSRMDTVTASR